MATALNADLSQYAIYTDYLRSGGEIPPAPTPAPEPVAPVISQPDVEENSVSDPTTGETVGANGAAGNVDAVPVEDSADVVFGIPRNLFYGIAGIIGTLLLISIGLLLFAIRSSSVPAARRQNVANRQDAPRNALLLLDRGKRCRRRQVSVKGRLPRRQHLPLTTSQRRRPRVPARNV